MKLQVTVANLSTQMVGNNKFASTWSNLEDEFVSSWNSNIDELDIH